MKIQSIQPGSDWKTQAANIINARVRGGVCFSSGEVARTLRLSDPSLRFSVLRVGDFIRELFDNDTLPKYGMYGGVYPVQVSRYTEDGVEVFVYGPTKEDCENHNFEVDIPDTSGVLMSVLHQIDQAMKDAVDAMGPYVDPAAGAYDTELAKAQAALKSILGI